MGYYIFFSLLTYVLPNKHHQNIFKNYIQKHPILDALKSRNSLVKWLFNYQKFLKSELKDDVSYGQLCYKYEKYRAGCEKSLQKKIKATCRIKEIKDDKFKKN
jgi:hypothetical protein